MVIEITYPDEVVHWFAGYGPGKSGSPCMHRCEHRDTATIAWGSDLKHYELVECAEAGGCARQCRAWQNPKGLTTTEWLNVAS